MKATINTVLAAFASVAAALPLEPSNATLPIGRQNSVQVLPADVHGPDVKSLQRASGNVTSSLRTFLQKYQPLANIASAQIGAKQQAVFTSAGHCFTEFPCFSVERGAMATIGSQEEVTQAQVSAILDDLTSSPTVTFSHDPATSLSGLKRSWNGATLEVIAAQGSVSTNFLAGMVFDMYKMQHDDPITNSIRAVQAKTDGHERPFVALCLYPVGANTTQAHNFCLGNELDGSPMPSPQGVTKRFSLKHGLSFICGFIKVPLLCHKN